MASKEITEIPEYVDSEFPEINTLNQYKQLLERKHKFLEILGHLEEKIYERNDSRNVCERNFIFLQLNACRDAIEKNSHFQEQLKYVLDEEDYGIYAYSNSAAYGDSDDSDDEEDNDSGEGPSPPPEEQSEKDDENKEDNDENKEVTFFINQSIH